MSALVATVALALLPSCAQKQAVKFGAVLPLTGSSAASPAIAQSLQRGMELAFEQLQADPEIKYELTFEIIDSEGDPAKAAELADQLYGDSLALVGGVTTEEAVAMAEVSKKAERLLISPTAIGDQLSGISRGTFYRLFPAAVPQASAMANFAKERLNVSQLVVIHEDRAFAGGVVGGLRSVFTQYGGKIVAEIPFAPAADLGPVVDQALETLAQVPLATPEDANGIYLATSGLKAAELIGLLRDRGYGTTEGKKEWIMTTSAFSHPAVFGKAGRAAEGVYLTAPLFDVDSQDPPMPAFLAAYRQKYNEDPDLYAGHGYDALLVYGAALKKTPNTLPSEFQKGFRSLGPVAGVTGSLQFNESGDAQKFPRVHIIRGGKLVDFQKWLQEAQAELNRKRDELRKEMERMRLQGQSPDTSE